MSYPVPVAPVPVNMGTMSIQYIFRFIQAALSSFTQKAFII